MSLVRILQNFGFAWVISLVSHMLIFAPSKDSKFMLFIYATTNFPAVQLAGSLLLYQ